MIPVPIIDSVEMFPDTVFVWSTYEVKWRDTAPTVEGSLPYRMVDNDPNRLEPAE